MELMDFVKRAAKITGRAIAALFLLPLCAAGAALGGAAFFLRAFWGTFAGAIVRSLTDPEHLPPLGMGNFGPRLVWGIKAARAEADGNREEAVRFWKKCASRFDTAAMLKLARHYRYGGDGDDEDGNKTLAAQWYAVAAGLGSAEGAEGYVWLTGLELTKKEKAWFRRNFIKYRKCAVS